jgi:hypothetical protein
MNAAAKVRPMPIARRFHLRTETRIGAGKLIERPARYFYDDVIERRFVSGFRYARHGILDLVERHAERDLGRDFRDRISRRFRSERGTARDARIDFDNVVFAALGMQRELDVATTLDVQRANDVDARRAQHLVFDIRERLRRRDDDRIARMNTDRIDVFHVTNDDAIVRAIAQNFVLDFFPPEQARLDERLMDERRLEPDRERRAQLRLVVHDAAARSAERICRPDHERVAHREAEGDARFDVRDDRARGDGLADRDHRILEARAILGKSDRIDRCAEQIETVAFDRAVVGQLDREVEARLAAEARQERVRTFALDDRFERGRGQRFEVHGIRDFRIGHDRRRVRVDEDLPVAFFSQRPASLNARVIELGGLPDHDRARANHEDITSGHEPSCTRVARRWPADAASRRRCYADVALRRPSPIELAAWMSAR